MVAPTDYGNLTGWWDISQESFSNNDPVQTFNDINGTRDFTQATLGNRPLYKTSIFPTGLPGLDFDGTNDTMISNDIDTFLSASTYSAFVVVWIDVINTTNSDAYLNDAIYGDTNGHMGLHLHGTTPNAELYSYDGAFKELSIAITTGAAHVIHTRHESGNIYISVDGGSESSLAAGNMTNIAGNFKIGQGNSSGGFLDGKIGEFFIYDAARSSGEITALINYLMAKWVTAGTNATAGNAAGAGAGNTTQSFVKPSAGAGAGAGAVTNATGVNTVVAPAVVAAGAGAAL